MDHIFTAIAGRIAAFAGRPAAFVIALALVIVWAATGPLFGFSEVWQLVINTGTTIVTFLMVFLVQNTQNRDSAAMQAKLDELLRAVEQAREQFIGIEHMTDARSRRSAWTSRTNAPPAATATPTRLSRACSDGTELSRPVRSPPAPSAPP